MSLTAIYKAFELRIIKVDEPTVTANRYLVFRYSEISLCKLTV